MNRDVQLAVLLRHMQWALDDAAHDAPAGRLTPERRATLALLCDQVAGALRDDPIVLDAPQV